MSTSELLDRQAVSGAHVNKCSRRKQTAKDGVRAWHADLRWHATPVAGPRIGGPVRAHVNAGPCADRPKCLDRAGPRVKRPRVRACVLRERETPHTPLSHTSVSAYTTRAAYQNSADEVDLGDPLFPPRTPRVEVSRPRSSARGSTVARPPARVTAQGVNA